MIVKIYLRAIVKGKKNYLALFDSNRSGDINDLITEVQEGATIIWKSDCCSGIKSITRIYSKEPKHPVFKSEPMKRLLCKGFKLKLENGLVVAPAKYVEEKYTIECILYDNTKLIIDPVIRVPPPPPPKE